MFNKKIIITISFLLLVLKSNYIIGAEIDTQHLVDSAFQRIKELNLHGNINEIDKSKLTIKCYNWDYNETIGLLDVRINKPEGYLRVYIDTATGRILEIYDSLPTTIHEGEDKPSKSKEKIIRQAEQYFKIINGKIPEDAYFYRCEFGVHGWHDTKHSYDGNWFIWWGRKSGDYVYKEDEIRVVINEKYGLSGYVYGFFSEYSPPKRINISQEKAIQTAKVSMRKIIYSPYFEGNFQGYKVGKYDSSKLIIVNPNYSHRKGPQGTDVSPKPFARLAWIVVFECVPKIKELPAGYCEAWIDAETGELLGGTGSQNEPF